MKSQDFCLQSIYALMKKVVCFLSKGRMLFSEGSFTL